MRGMKGLGYTKKEDEQRLRQVSETSEAFIYVAMSRLMVRRWPASEAFRTVALLQTSVNSFNRQEPRASRRHDG